MRKTILYRMENTNKQITPGQELHNFEDEYNLKIKAMNSSSENVSRHFNEVKYQAMVLSGLCFMFWLNMIDLKQPLTQFSTWFPEGSSGWIILCGLTFLTWRVALTGELVMMGQLPSAPAYIYTAISYIMLYAGLMGVIIGRQLYDLLFPKGSFLAIAAWIVSALVLFLLFRVHNRRQIIQWFNSFLSSVLFPLNKRTGLEFGQSLLLNSYAVLIGIAMFYFFQHSFRV